METLQKNIQISEFKISFYSKDQNFYMSYTLVEKTKILNLIPQDCL